MNEVERDVGLALLMRLRQRKLLSEEHYRAACCSQFFDRRSFTKYARDTPNEVMEVDQHDDH